MNMKIIVMMYDDLESEGFVSSSDRYGVHASGGVPHRGWASGQDPQEEDGSGDNPVSPILGRRGWNDLPNASDKIQRAKAGAEGFDEVP